MRVLTIGTFDLFHYGHLRLIERAAEFGELTVGVNSDRFVFEYKGRETVSWYTERASIVAAIRGVKAVRMNDGHGDKLIRSEKPDLLVIGSDWHDRYLPQINMTAEELFDELGCSVIYLPRTKNVSTTELLTYRG